MPYKDITNRREAQKRYYNKNKQLYRDKNIRRRRELAEFVNSLKQSPCVDCGKIYPHYVMDFDHRDRNLKLDSIARMVKFRMLSKENILKEIEKCDLVCSNCHRIRTNNL